jgi:hypothetical protein
MCGLLTAGAEILPGNSTNHDLAYVIPKEGGAIAVENL